MKKEFWLITTVLLPILCLLLLVVIVVKCYIKGGWEFHAYDHINIEMVRIREMDIKNYIYYLFDVVINIKSLDLNNIKIDEKLYQDILIYYNGYVTSNSVKTLYIIINNANEYIEENNGNNYLAQNSQFLWTKARLARKL